MHNRSHPPLVQNAGIKQIKLIREHGEATRRPPHINEDRLLRDEKDTMGVAIQPTPVLTRAVSGEQLS